MENGVKAVDNERLPGEMRMEGEDGDLLLEPVAGDAGGSHKSDEGNDAEENEAFEEAMDNENFHTSHHDMASGSLDFAFEGGELIGVEKFDESTDAQVDDKTPDQGRAAGSEKSDEPAEAQGSDLGTEQQEAVASEKFDEPLDALVNSQSPEEGTVDFEEKTETFDEADHTLEEVAEVEADDMIEKGIGDVEVDSSVLEDGGERVAEYSEEELLGEKSKNGKFNGVDSDGSHLISNEKAENGESHHDESEEQVCYEDSVSKKQDVSFGLDVPSNNFHPSQDHSECMEEELVREKFRSVELIGANSDGSGLIVNEKSGNGVSNDTEFEEHVSHEDGVPKKQDVSVGLDVPSNNSYPSVALSECSEKELVGENSRNGELNGVNSDRSCAIVNEKAKNGESHDAKSKEHVSYEDGIPKEQEVSVGLGVPSDSTHPSQDLSETANGIKADTCESVAKEGRSAHSHATGGIKEPLKQHEGDIRSADNKPQVKDGFEKESVLVEDFSESSSTDDDDTRTHSQPAPPANSRPRYVGTSPLPSRPAGLGSSAPVLEHVGASTLPSHPAGLGSSAPLLEPAHRSLQQSRANSSVPQRRSHTPEELANDDAEEDDETRQKLQMIRVKFLRLAHRLGQTPHNIVVAQVLYRLGLAEQLRRNTNRPGVFSFDRASVLAEQLEAAGQEPLDFSCTIMVIGKTGVGKSATINSIFDEVKFHTDAFQSSTQKVQDIVGTVQGIKVRVIDTPGLFSSTSDQRRNEKILRSVKRFISKSPPDIVLYFDRLDVQSWDYGDIPVLRTITEIFGTSIWFNAIVVLTHAASAPPEGPNGTALSYEMFVTQRSHVVQQAIHRATGDMRLMNPVSLVENHSACRMNRAGQRVLPNGQVWKPQLLLLSFASKILAEANMLLKLQDSPPGKPFGSRSRVPPLPFLLSSLLQSRPQLKLPEEQFGDDDTMDEDLDEASDSDDGSDYDELPPFKRLNKAQLDKLSKAQKKAYFEEIDYREKLFFRKQLKEEKKRRKLMKKMAAEAKDLPNDYNDDNLEDESSGPATVPVPMPDYVLPASFDSDNPSHRYRFLDSSSQWLVRPVLDSQGWDHDVGYEGLNVERSFVVKDKIPMSVSGQLTKDKKECNLQMEVASSIKHSEGKATSLGLDMQTVGKDMAYTFRGETRFQNFRRNNTAAGLSVTVLGDTVSAGMKIEDKLMISKTLRLLMSGGAMTGRGDVAYGGRLEATLRDKDYPVGRMLSTLALSIVDWHGDLALGCNIQSQFPLGRGTNLICHANLNNKGSGQVGIRLNSSEHLQIALLALVPIFRNLKRMLSDSSQPM